MPLIIDVPRFFCRYCGIDFEKYKDAKEHEDICDNKLEFNNLNQSKDEVVEEKQIWELIE